MKTFGLLGERLSHSFSPMIHSMLGDYSYLLFENRPDEVGRFLTSRCFDGLNVTIPYKKTVMAYCDVLSETAQRIGSVNTIICRRDGTLYGGNTDYYGFHHMLGESGIQIAGKKALILGSGGASVTVRAVLEDMKAAEIITISRSGRDNYENINRHYDGDILVNTTPVGMYPENGQAPVRLANFHRCSGVFDLIYNPSKTRLLLDAEELGISYKNGLGMLVAQAKRAAEIFTDKSIDDIIIGKIVKKIARQTMNIILIGMPGSGKSTTGKLLSSLSGRKFIDTDELIVSAAGKSIESIFSEDGENAFRGLETDILSDVTKLSGTVIATGGGVVTQPQNRGLLKQNSTVIFLNRPPEELVTDGRPLSIKRGVDALYTERLPLYRQWCDYEFECHGAQQTAENIYNLLLSAQLS